MIPDLSHWQNVTSFAAMKAAGIERVILKATQGADWIDPTFVRRSALAQAAGLEVSAYHFLDGTDPLMQVRHYLAVAGHLPKLALDVEPNGVGGTVSVLQAAQAVMYLHALSGILPAVYIGRYGPDGHGTGLPNAVLARCPLWLPNYNSGPPTTEQLPLGWTSYVLWQHTENGACPGVAGPCDLSDGDGW